MEGKLFNTMHVSFFGFTGMTAVWFCRFDCYCFFIFQFLLLNIEAEWTDLMAKLSKTNAILGYFRRSIEKFSNATESNFCAISIHCHQRSDVNNLFGVLVWWPNRTSKSIYLKLAVEIPICCFHFFFSGWDEFLQKFVFTCCGFCHLKESLWA